MRKLLILKCTLISESYGPPSPEMFLNILHYDELVHTALIIYIYSLDIEIESNYKFSLKHAMHMK